MGARLWSHRRSARAAHTSPAAHHHAHTIIAPTTFTHSDKVLVTTTNPSGEALPRHHNQRRHHLHHTNARFAKCPRSPEVGAPRPMEDWKDGLPVPSKSASSKKKKSKYRKDSWSSVEEAEELDPRQALHPTTMPVLYACKEMSSSMGEAMAAARDRATRYSSVQQDTTLGLPYQVPRPDGEERHHTRKHLTGSEQEAEIMREYIKPPANKTLFDVDTDGPHRSCSVGVFPTQPECGASHPGVTYHHRHSAPLETRSSHHPAVSASSSSSSLPGWGCGDDGRGSPRRGRKAGGSSQKTPLMLTPFSSSSKYERAPHSSQQEGGRRGSQHQGRLGTSSPSPSRDPSISLPYCPSTNTLADITMVSVPCGPSTHSSSSGHLGGPGGFQGAHMGSLGLPGDLPIMYGQSSDSPCSPTADHDLPPLYSDVMESSSLYTSASRPSEQRTKSGEI
ncbi:uncharacterized protein [Cherax quadricarinatus]|nr:uncharacterized protein LOC128690040 isoform X1 [Cherax quadricarinatus]